MEVADQAATVSPAKPRASVDLPEAEGGKLKAGSPRTPAAGSRESLHVQFHKNVDEFHEDDVDVEDVPATQDLLGVKESPGSSRSSGSAADDDDDDDDDYTEFGDEDEEASLTEPQPPDGGYGWVVVVAALATNMIADGITFSFGVIYVELLDYFHDGSGKTAWIGGLFMAMPLLCGPVASYLTDRFGCRKVCMFGGCMSAFGFIVSSFADSINVLIFTFGIVSGVGLALCYVTAVVIVAYYFDKRRSLAMGLAVCGSGIGTVVFAPITNFLISEYGWRGTTLLLAGVFLNMAVCGALMRDLEWTKARSKQQRKDRKAKNRERRSRNYSQSLRTQTSSQASSALILDSTYIEELKKLLEKGELTEKLIKEPLEKQTNIAEQARFCSSLVNLPTYVRNGEKVPFEVLELLSNNQQLYQTLLQSYPGLMQSSHSFSDGGRLHELAAAGGGPHPEQSSTKLLDRNSPAAQGVIPHPGVKRPPLPASRRGNKKSLVSDDSALEETCRLWMANCGDSSSDRSLNACHLKGIRMHRNSMSYRGAMLNINKYRIRASSCPDIYRNSMITIAKEDNEPCAWLWDILDVFRDMVDISLFSDMQFLLFSVSNFLLYSWYHVPYVFLTDKAITMGIDSVDAAYLISYLGILNMVGEVIMGWAGDQTWLNAGLVYAVCMTICGVSTLIMPFVSSYVGLASLAGVFGFSIAANYSLASIILVELMSIDRFTCAYGLLLLVQGVANLLGPPVAGWLKDVNGDYDMSFYLAGLFIILCGVLLLILPANKWLRKIQARRRVKYVETNGCFSENMISTKDANLKNASLLGQDVKLCGTLK